LSSTSDPDLDALTYTVYGSDDNGGTYDYVVATGLTPAAANCTPAPCDTTWDTVAAGIATGTQNDQVKFKVEANDGNGGLTPAESNAFSVNNTDTVAPSAVSTLLATTGGPGEVNLAWTAVGDDAGAGTADSYDIRYDTSDIVNDAAFLAATPLAGVPAPQATGSPEAMTASGLTEGVTYYFAMKVLDEVPNTSALSSPSASADAGVTVINNPPTAPAISAPADASTQGGTVSIQWTESTDPDVGDTVTYSVYGSEDAGVSFDHVIATGLTAATANCTPAPCDVAWNTVAAGIGLSVVDADVQVQVEATDGKVGGTSSNTTANFNVDNVETNPPTFDDLSVAAEDAVAASGDTVNLTWSAASDPEGSVPITYNIWWSTGAISYGVPDATTQAASYQVTGLTTDQSYNFAVRAEDFLGNRETNSTTVSATPTAPPPPFDVIPPAQITLVATEGSSVGEVDLSWTAVGDDGDAVGETASLYDIRFSTADIADDTQFGAAAQVVGEPAPQVRGSAEAMTISGLTPGVTYYFAIRAGDEVPNWGPRSASDFAAAGSDVTAPSAVTTLAAATGGSGEVMLTWTAVGDDAGVGTADSYDIRYDTADIVDDAAFLAATPLAGTPLPQVSGSTETMIVSGLPEGQTFYFAMKVSDEAGNPSPLSPPPDRRFRAWTSCPPSPSSRGPLR
jgi:hypothetical protein